MNINQNKGICLWGSQVKARTKEVARVAVIHQEEVVLAHTKIPTLISNHRIICIIHILVLEVITSIKRIVGIIPAVMGPWVHKIVKNLYHLSTSVI